MFEGYKILYIIWSGEETDFLARLWWQEIQVPANEYLIGLVIVHDINNLI